MSSPHLQPQNEYQIQKLPPQQYENHNILSDLGDSRQHETETDPD